MDRLKIKPNISKTYKVARKFDPTKEELDALISIVQQEFDNKEYQKLRKDKYPSFADQLDMLYHDKIDGTNTWLDAIQEVKAKYPKP